jgi:outer membrane biosynthesis protein TonB
LARLEASPSDAQSFGRRFAAINSMNEKACSKIPGGFMNKQFQPLLLGALVLFLSVGISLNAQQTTPQNQTPNQQTQPVPPPSAQQPAPPTSDEPAPPPSAQSPTSNQTSPTPPPPDQGNSAPAPGQPGQTAPDAQAPQTPPPTGVQAFSGTIVQQGDRYMLKDEASGQTYDLDHQTEVQKFAGKRVRVHGTLDPTGKMIHLQ